MQTKKFPLLEQLRAERERHEAKITAPIREMLAMSRAESARLTNRARSLEHFLGSAVAKHVAAEIAHDLSAHVRNEIMKSIAAAGRSAAGEFTISLPLDVVRLLDLDSVERSIIDEYIQQTIPDMSVSMDMNVCSEKTVTLLDVRIPKVGIRRAIAA